MKLQRLILPVATVLILCGCGEPKIQGYSDNYYKGTPMSEYKPPLPSFEDIKDQETPSETPTENQVMTDSKTETGSTLKVEGSELYFPLSVTKADEVKKLVEASTSTAGTTFITYNDKLQNSSNIKTLIDASLTAENMQFIKSDDIADKYVYSPIDADLTDRLTVDNDTYKNANGVYAVTQCKIGKKTCRISYKHLKQYADTLSKVSVAEDDKKFPIVPISQSYKNKKEFKQREIIGSMGISGTWKINSLPDRKTLFDNVWMVTIVVECKDEGSQDYKNISLKDFYALKNGDNETEKKDNEKDKTKNSQQVEEDSTK